MIAHLSLALFSLLFCAALSFDARDYDDLTNDFSCARKNHEKQKKLSPRWRYGIVAPSRARQPVQYAWEPILEPVKRCNGLNAGWTKHFKFLVVLDASWIHHYKEHKSSFAIQGYPTLIKSVNVLLERVSYLLRKQFGVTVSASRVVAFDTLGEACAANENIADDGTPRTSTRKHLESAGISARASDAGTLRIGIGSLSGTYCHSHAPLSALCSPDAIVTTMRPAFQRGTGRMTYDAASTLAHELAHFFGVCPEANPHCLNNHAQNELPDIQVWNGEPAVRARPEGKFFKFLTACTPLYRDTFCEYTKKAGPRCAKRNAPPTLAGDYVAKKYWVAGTTNDWHFVKVTEVRKGTTYRWTNRAGKSWTLTRSRTTGNRFSVGRNPYTSTGYKKTKVVTATTKDGREIVTGIYGPSKELYVLRRLL